METSGNLDGLVKRILEQAREEAAAVAERSAKAVDREVQRARQVSSGRKEAMESALRDASKRRIYSRRAEAEQERRRAAMNAREEAVESVFVEALRELKEIGDPSERRNLLEALIREGIRAVDGRSVRVRLNPTERKLLLGSDFPEEIDGVTVTIDEDCIDAAGGPIVSDDSGRVVFENTFEARLARMRESLRRLVVETLELDEKRERANG